MGSGMGDFILLVAGVLILVAVDKIQKFYEKDKKYNHHYYIKEEN